MVVVMVAIGHVIMWIQVVQILVPYSDGVRVSIYRGQLQTQPDGLFLYWYKVKLTEAAAAYNSAQKPLKHTAFAITLFILLVKMVKLRPAGILRGLHELKVARKGVLAAHRLAFSPVVLHHMVERKLDTIPHVVLRFPRTRQRPILEEPLHHWAHKKNLFLLRPQRRSGSDVWVAVRPRPLVAPPHCRRNPPRFFCLVERYRPRLVPQAPRPCGAPRAYLQHWDFIPRILHFGFILKAGLRGVVVAVLLDLSLPVIPILTAGQLQLFEVQNCGFLRKVINSFM